MNSNYYLIQLFDKMHNAIAPFGHIDFLKLPKTYTPNYTVSSVTFPAYSSTGAISPPLNNTINTTNSTGSFYTTTTFPTLNNNSYTYSSSGAYQIIQNNSVWPFSYDLPQSLYATYINITENEGAQKFMSYFSIKENMNKNFCGSIFASNPLKPMFYFDDAYLRRIDFKDDNIEFEIAVNDFETIS